MKEPITYLVDRDGIGWITFDDSTAKANLFTLETLACFKKVLGSLFSESGLKAIVIQSAKEGIFIAGANLHWIEQLDSAMKAFEFAKDGQKFLNSIANFKVPVIAAIHGACAGGGYEMALACHYRLATDHLKTRIGLSEVALGAMPAWGSCMRLPRLIGIRSALDHILKAQLLPAAAAREQGFVDEIVPVGKLRDRARQIAEKVAKNDPERVRECRATILAADQTERRPGHRRAVAALSPRQSLRRSAGWRAAKAERPPYNSAFEKEKSGGAAICSEIRKTVQAEPRGRFLAGLKVIEVIEKGIELSIEEALDLEARGFSEVIPTPECRSLIRAFFSARQVKTDG